MRIAKLAFAAVLSFLPVRALADEVPAAAPVATPAPAAPIGPKVLISTSMGDIILQLDAVHAPRTVANFVRYAKSGHFDGTVFYRAEKNFVIQAGSWDAKKHFRQPVYAPIPLESSLPNNRGTIAMARGTEPASGTTEFFINLTDNPLNADPNAAPNTTGYAAFGQVVTGMDVADKIGGVPVTDGGVMPAKVWPVDPVTILKVSVLPAAPAP